MNPAFLRSTVSQNWGVSLCGAPDTVGECVSGMRGFAATFPQGHILLLSVSQRPHIGQQAADNRRIRIGFLQGPQFQLGFI